MSLFIYRVFDRLIAIPWREFQYLENDVFINTLIFLHDLVLMGDKEDEVQLKLF